MPSTDCVDKVTEYRLVAKDVGAKAGLGNGTVFSTREDGEEFRHALVSELEALPSPCLVKLDFSDLELVDASFLDTGIAVLALMFSRGAHKDQYLLLVGLNRGSRQNLDYAINSRIKREEKQVRNLVLAVELEAGEIECVGKLEDHLTKPLECVRRARTTTARDLADALDLDVAAASTKLKTLYDLHLVRREEVRDEQGKQYSYRFFA